MPGKLQPLVSNQSIVNSDGTPTQYFIRWAQQRQIDISDGITAAEAQQLVDDGIAHWAAARHVNAGTGLGGGGTLDNDVTLHLDATIGQLNDVDLSTPPTDTQVLVYDATTSKWIPANQSGGGGGSGALTKIAQVVISAPQSHIIFAGIPQSYDDLVLVGNVVTQPGAGSNSVVCQLNGDTAAHYSSQNWNHYGVGSHFGLDRMWLCDTGSYIGASIPQGNFEGAFQNYKNTTGGHRYVGISSFSSPSDLFSENICGQQFTGGVPIAQIDLFFDVGSNFDVGTVVTLYGRGG